MTLSVIQSKDILTSPMRPKRPIRLNEKLHLKVKPK